MNVRLNKWFLNRLAGFDNNISGQAYKERVLKQDPSMSERVSQCVFIS